MALIGVPILHYKIEGEGGLCPLSHPSKEMALAAPLPEPRTFPKTLIVCFIGP